MQRFIVILLIAWISASPYRVKAGAWGQPTGQTELITSAFFYQTEEYVAPDGTVQPQPTFRKYSLFSYLEHGLTEDWTIGANLELAHARERRQNGQSQQNSGVGVMELFGRYQLAREENWALSIQPLVALPSSYETDPAPDIGHDQTDLQVGILFGGTFSLLGRLHYVDTALHYRHRLSTPSDQLRGEVTLGLRITDDWELLTQLFHIHNLGDAIAGPQGVRLTPEEDYRLTKLQISGLYHMTEDVALQLGGFAHLHARNTGGDGGGMAALWLNW